MVTTWTFNGRTAMMASTGIIVQVITGITPSNTVAITTSITGIITKIASIIIILASVIFVFMMNPGISEVIDIVIDLIIDITQIVGTEGFALTHLNKIRHNNVLL